MSPVDFLVIGAIVFVVGGAVGYIIWAKKSGKKCIGCPDSAACERRKCGGNCSLCGCTLCNNSEREEETPDNSN